MLWLIHRYAKVHFRGKMSFEPSQDLFWFRFLSFVFPWPTNINIYSGSPIHNRMNDIRSFFDFLENGPSKISSQYCLKRLNSSATFGASQFILGGENPAEAILAIKHELYITTIMFRLINCLYSIANGFTSSLICANCCTFFVSPFRFPFCSTLLLSLYLFVSFWIQIQFGNLVLIQKYGSHSWHHVVISTLFICNWVPITHMALFIP